MPIAAAQSVIESQIKAALSLDKGANIDATATIIAAGIASGVPMGLFPTAPTPPFPIPLSPTGLSATQNGIKAALSLDKGANIDTTAQLIAQAISLMAPIVPPAGLSGLISQIKNALSLDKGANSDTFAKLVSVGVVAYYQAAGVL